MLWKYIKCIVLYFIFQLEHLRKTLFLEMYRLSSKNILYWSTGLILVFDGRFIVCCNTGIWESRSVNWQWKGRLGHAIIMLVVKYLVGWWHVHNVQAYLLVLFSNGVLSASEIQSSKIIKSYITGKLFLMIRFLQLQEHSSLKRTGRKASTLTAPL